MADREGATIICDSAECLKWACSISEENDLPFGLLPLTDYIEIGHVKETGYFWLKQKKATYHNFDKIGRLVYYGTDISGYVEKRRIKNVKGVQAKELFLWTTIKEITVIDDRKSKREMVEFKVVMGITRCFPSEAFAIDE